VFTDKSESYPVFTYKSESKTVHSPQHRLILGSTTAASMNHQTAWQIPHLGHQKEFGNHLTDYRCSYHISLSTETMKEYLRLYIAQSWVPHRTDSLGGDYGHWASRRWGQCLKFEIFLMLLRPYSGHQTLSTWLITRGRLQLTKI
jgi:hypothetical protein